MAQWSTGLIHPLNVCCLPASGFQCHVCCCRPCTHGEISKIEGGNGKGCCLAMIPYVGGAINLMIHAPLVAKKAGIGEEDPNMAFVKGLCCGPCYTCQVRLEMKKMEQAATGGGATVGKPSQQEMM